MALLGCCWQLFEPARQSRENPPPPPPPPAHNTTHLERDHKLALFLARQVYVAELAATQGPPNVKVRQLPLLRLLAARARRRAAPLQPHGRLLRLLRRQRGTLLLLRLLERRLLLAGCF
jgi:hypothetical protein